MTSSELIKVILKEMKVEMRKIVREEIQRALNPSERKSNLETISHGRSLVDLTENQEKRNELRKNFAKKMVEFTKDPVLNKILNETANSVAKEKQESIPSVGGKMFTSADVGSGIKPPIMNQMVVEHKVEEMLPEDRKHAAGRVPDFLAKALTRNYSDLVNSKSFNKRNNGG